MVYIDPPYGIKYGSNFQPFVGDTSLKSGDKDEDLSQEPEMIKAIRSFFKALDDHVKEKYKLVDIKIPFRFYTNKK